MSVRKVKLGNCIYNPETRIILWPNGEQHRLESKSANFLELLYTHSNCYLSHTKVQNTIWVGNKIEEDTIQNMLTTLRQDLGVTPEYKYIESHRSEGYCFVAEVKELPFINRKWLAFISVIVIVTSLLTLLFYKFL